VEKLLGVLKSRKFWAGVVGLLVAVGLLNLGEDAAEENLVEAILTVVTTVVYILSVAIEDAGRAQGGVLPPSELPKEQATDG
jgi:hypothetical protein